MALAGATMANRTDSLKELSKLIEQSNPNGVALYCEEVLEGNYVAVGNLAGYFAEITWGIEIFSLDSEFYSERFFWARVTRTKKNWVGYKHKEFRSTTYSSPLDCLLWIDKKTMKTDKFYVNYEDGWQVND